MCALIALSTELAQGRRAARAADDVVDLGRDRALVLRAQDGDVDAFADLYRRYRRRLYRFCLRRLHDRSEAEDCAQEAFERAWKALPRFEGERRFYPWLSVIAVHLCTNAVHKRSRSMPVGEFHQTNVVSTESTGEERVLSAVDADLVARAFERLSERYRRVLRLREGSGWSYQRIAREEGIPLTAVETLLWRARQALKREFTALADAGGRVATIGGIVWAGALRRFLGTLGRSAGSLVPAHRPLALALRSTTAVTAVAAAVSLSAGSSIFGAHPTPPTQPSGTGSGPPAAWAHHGVEVQGSASDEGTGSPATGYEPSPPRAADGGNGPAAVGNATRSPVEPLQSLSAPLGGVLAGTGEVVSDVLLAAQPLTPALHAATSLISGEETRLLSATAALCNPTSPVRVLLTASSGC